MRRDHSELQYILGQEKGFLAFSLDFMRSIPFFSIFLKFNVFSNFILGLQVLYLCVCQFMKREKKGERRTVGEEGKWPTRVLQTKKYSEELKNGAKIFKRFKNKVQKIYLKME